MNEEQPQEEPDFVEENNPYEPKQPESKINMNKIFVGIVWLLIIAVLVVYGWKIIQAVLGAIS